MNGVWKVRANKLAKVCRLFGHSKRILILWSLAEEEKSVGEIASAIESSVQCTSQHLRLMREKGILETRRDGQSIYYRIDQEELINYCQHIMLARPQEETNIRINP